MIIVDYFKHLLQNLLIYMIYYNLIMFIQFALFSIFNYFIQKNNY